LMLSCWAGRPGPGRLPYRVSPRKSPQTAPRASPLPSWQVVRQGLGGGTDRHRAIRDRGGGHRPGDRRLPDHGSRAAQAPGGAAGQMTLKLRRLIWDGAGTSIEPEDYEVIKHAQRQGRREGRAHLLHLCRRPRPYLELDRVRHRRDCSGKITVPLVTIIRTVRSYAGITAPL
jgi:hypothetical protein